MNNLFNSVKGALGLGADGQQSTDQGSNSEVMSKAGLDSDRMLQYTNMKWEDRRNAYIVYHQSIWQALLFYANQSWIDWDDARKVWQPQQPTDEWIPRPRINRFSPTVDAVASNFSQVPEVEAVPDPIDDPQNNMIALVANKLSEYIMCKESLKHQTGEQPDYAGIAAQLFVLCGAAFSIIRVKKNHSQRPQMGMIPSQAFLCQNCDKYAPLPPGQVPPQFCPQCGNEVQAEDTQQMGQLTGPDGNPAMEDFVESVDLSLDIGNPLWAFPPAGANDMKEAPDFLWGSRAPIDYIWNKWQFEATPDAIWPDGYAVTYEYALNFWYTGYSSSTLQVKDSALVLEMYVPPNKVRDFPKGFYNVVINDKVAFEEEWEFPEHPVTMAEYLRLPTIFFPRSISFDLVEIQRELNAYESLIKLHAMTTAVDPVMQDIATVVTEITGRSDKIIKYRKPTQFSEAPSRLGAGHLDDGIYAQRDSLHNEFQNISMAVNAFRGQQEGSVNAAAGISQLRQQAELMFGKPSKNWNNFWRETIRKYVKFIQKYYSLQQIVEIAGQDYIEECQMFKGANLDRAIKWVTSATGLPRTRQERRDELMMMFDKGALDINDPAVKQRVFELFGETGLMQSFNKDATNARLENQLFRAGKTAQEIQPMPIIEDMATHLYFHKDQAKSRDFQKWQPDAKQQLIMHIMMTQQAFEAAQIKATMKQLSAKAASESISSLHKGGPHTEEASQSSGDIQQTALDTAKDMGKTVQGQKPGLGPRTPVPPGERVQ